MNQRELFLRHVAQTSDQPMMGIDIDIVKAKGATLTDRNGKNYTDLISGISVSSIGHCHPKVIKAIQEQSEQYMHLMVYGEFNQKPQVDYAELLCRHLPQHLNCVYFTTSGSEAVEGAMKLAKRATGRSEILAFKNAYHGSTQGALSIMGNEEFKRSFRPLLPGIQFLELNRFEDLNRITNSIAAVIIEPIQGEAGVHEASREYLDALRICCDKNGVLLIFDEIQTGFGRTGKLFAFENYNVVPDILLMAKGMGGGLPIGAFVASRELMSQLSHDPVLGHINTFGGNSVCVAAAHAALTVILEEEINKRAQMIEDTVKSMIRHPLIREVRIKGALGAVEFYQEEIARKVITTCIENGVISDWFLFCPNAMRIAPPLLIQKEELESALKVLLDAMDAVQGQS